MGKKTPRLYARYSIDSALAAVGDPTRAEWKCNRNFAVMPRAILWFVTLGDGHQGSVFERAAELTWRPKKGARRQRDDEQTIVDRTIHLFCRAEDEDEHLFVGKTRLDPWFSCTFETVVVVTPRLRRDIWQRFGGLRGFQLEVGGKRVPLASEADLALHLAAIRRARHADVGLYGPKGDWFHGLFAGDRAFLMYMPEIGEAGMSSRDPKYSGPPEATVNFVCSNGERICFPARFTVSREQGLKAISQFFRTGKTPRFIRWEDE